MLENWEMPLTQGKSHSNNIIDSMQNAAAIFRAIYKCILMVVLVLMLAITINAPANASCGRDGVVLFAAYWCPYCRRAEIFLKAQQIPYRRIETSNNRRIQLFMLRQFGTTGVPVIVIDNSFRVGFDEGWLKKALCLQ